MSSGNAADTSDSNQLTHLFRYTRWANDRVIGALREASLPVEGDGEKRPQTLLSHLLRAQSIWWGRVTGGDEADLELWATDTLDACADRSARSTERWIELVAPPADLHRTIRYRNSSGTAFEQQLREIAHHVVNHGTHHRAQIAQTLRRAGIEPPATDYIFFLRDETANPRTTPA